jgi:hypothetical protein
MIGENGAIVATFLRGARGKWKWRERAAAAERGLNPDVNRFACRERPKREPIARIRS